jgi:hypothetical protein
MQNLFIMKLHQLFKAHNSYYKCHITYLLYIFPSLINLQVHEFIVNDVHMIIYDGKLYVQNVKNSLTCKSECCIFIETINRSVLNHPG